MDKVTADWAERAKDFAKDVLRDLPTETPRWVMAFVAEIVIRAYLKGVDDRGAS